MGIPVGTPRIPGTGMPEDPGIWGGGGRGDGMQSFKCPHCGYSAMMKSKTYCPKCGHLMVRG